MLSVDLSQHLEAYSKQQGSCECDGAPPCRKNACQHAAKTRDKRPRARALRVSHVKANRGTGDEIVSCISFRQASSLGIVVFLLYHTLVDFTVLFAVVGAAVSTVSMAHELRLETLDRRKEREEMRQSMLQASLELRLAMHELEQAQAELLSLAPRVTFQLDLDEEPDAIYNHSDQ
jgi:hypothetical protein